MTPPATRQPALQPSATPPPSPAERAHQLQVARVARLRGQLAELDALEQAHRAAHLAQVAPLQARHVQAQKQLVRALDAVLAETAGTASLSAAQRTVAREHLCELAQSLAEDGHADMAALHDAHSPETLAQKRRQRADDLRALIEAALGAPLDGLEEASPEAVLHAGFERLRAAGSEGREARQLRRAARKARADQAPPAVQADADALLRRLYRQLASALHPDREPDPAQRQRKTALMSEANAAYEKRDWLGLLALRGRAALDHGTALPEDSLAALTHLLKQQVAALERERAARQQALTRLFDLPDGVSANANTLRQACIDEVQRLEAALDEAQQALAQTTNGVRLKRWLNGLRRR